MAHGMRTLMACESTPVTDEPAAHMAVDMGTSRPPHAPQWFQPQRVLLIARPEAG